MKKRSLALLLTLVLVLSFGLMGCSKKDAPATSEETKTTDTAKEDKVEPKKEDKELVATTYDKVLPNAKARKAMSLIIEKSFLTDEILGNGAKPANYLVPNVKSSFGAGFRDKYPDGFLAYNPEEAAKVWAEAKAEIGFDTVEIEMLLGDSDLAKKIGEYLQSQLQKLDGLTIKLNMQPWENRLELTKNGEFQIYQGGWGPDYLDPMTYMDMYEIESQFNHGDYINEEYDALIKNAKSGDLAFDLEARWDALQEGEKLLIEEGGITPLFQKGLMILQQDYLTGLVKHTFGGDYTYDLCDTKEIDGKKIVRQTYISDIPSMDQSKATDQTSFEMMANVYECLFKLDENDAAVLAGAESYEMSEDGLTVTFKLREDAKWSNGASVTAHDYVFSWRRLVNPETGGQYSFMGDIAGIKNAAEASNGEVAPEELGVTAIDDYTLEVQLARPVPYFTSVLTFPSFAPLNEEFFTSVGENYGTSEDTVIYNGPFVLTNWEAGYGFELAKNEVHRNFDEIKIDGVSWRIVKETAASVALYEDGEIDRVGLSGEFIDKYIDDPNVINLESLSIFYLEYKQNNF